MNNKKMIYLIIGVLVTITVAIGVMNLEFVQPIAANSGLTLNGKPNKENFILGEPVSVEFTFTNSGESPVLIGESGVEVGSLKIFIANDRDGEFKEYFVGSWGRLQGRKISLEPGQVHKYNEVNILWHGKPDVSHLNETAAKRVLAGKITTEYAFQEPGFYLIKGVSYFGENATPIESKPIGITVTQPVGDDLEIWNEIRGNSKIAYFLQFSEFSVDEEEKKLQLFSLVEEIYTKFPNSVFASYLKPNLEKFKTKEAHRKEFYKNIPPVRKP